MKESRWHKYYTRKWRSRTWSIDGWGSFISLNTILLGCCNIMRIGVGRPSDNNISIVIQDSLRNKLSANGVTTLMTRREREYVKVVRKHIRSRIWWHLPKPTPRHGCQFATAQNSLVYMVDIVQIELTVRQGSQAVRSWAVECWLCLETTRTECGRIPGGLFSVQLYSK